MEVQLVLVNFPNRNLAREIAGKLIEAKLAACVNLLPGVESIYQWEGKIEREEEVTAVIKTTPAAYAELEAMVLELHPYECPEVIKLALDGGAETYLQWVRDSVQGA
ncbi:divalent-cation tolerance protein CutA [Rubritalea marina]|uniref:divalent-cation tolerance protein CutA n=1 Tax=Rubritalea marina TaxID=361055 RepID=UPI000382B42A|nr:divalent-cation tolerance protein CutA [Rubritalea marina]